MDWPISWQKVKDTSDNTGGGSGGGLPVIDLREYVVSYDESASITDETVSALLDSAAQAESPIIAKFKTKPDSNGNMPLDEIVAICSVGYSLLEDSTRDASFGAYVPPTGFAILRLDGRWEIFCVDYSPATT